MPQLFVRIINRDSRYTNVNKAKLYVRRELAALVSGTYELPIEIRMLEAAEIKAIQSGWNRSRVMDFVRGTFGWFVGDSGGSRLMKDYTGTSGGHRVLKASHGENGELDDHGHRVEPKPALHELDNDPA